MLGLPLSTIMVEFPEMHNGASKNTSSLELREGNHARGQQPCKKEQKGKFFMLEREKSAEGKLIAIKIYNSDN